MSVLKMKVNAGMGVGPKRAGASPGADNGRNIIKPERQAPLCPHLSIPDIRVRLDWLRDRLSGLCDIGTPAENLQHTSHNTFGWEAYGIRTCIAMGEEKQMRA
jgi:hypothetical protein